MLMVEVLDEKAQQEVLDGLRAGQTVREIADARGTTVQAIYDILSRLRARGLVEKHHSPGFRVK